MKKPEQPLEERLQRAREMGAALGNLTIFIKVINELQDRIEQLEKQVRVLQHGGIRYK